MHTLKFALAGAGLLAAGATIAYLADGADRGAVLRAGAVAASVGFVAAGLLAGVWEGSRPYRLRQRVPLAPEAVRRHAAGHFGRAPWVPARDEPGEQLFWRRLEPNLAAVVLFGWLYYLAGVGRKQTVAIVTASAPDGTDLEIWVSSRSNDGQRIAARFVNSLTDSNASERRD